jgi:catechol 2,3-dioxygenase-like lactoylglutathione lyase family enzyme
MKRALLYIVALAAVACGAAQRASGVRSLALTVHDTEQSTAFFVDGLGFQRAGEGDVKLGSEEVLLHAPPSPGRPVPADTRSNDLWFEHMAIVVSDMDRAYAKLKELGVTPISAEPQTIPLTNPAAGGIRAYYFRDGDGHSLEIIWYPAGKGDPRWQDKARLFLGIDHTAIAVHDTEQSIAFYQGLLGLEVKGHSLNEGVEQERLSGVAGARVRITGLRGKRGPGVELLEYLAPGPGRSAPDDTAANDLWYWEIDVAVNDLRAVAAKLRAAGVKVVEEGIVPGQMVVRDPDGHHVRLIQES